MCRRLPACGSLQLKSHRYLLLQLIETQQASSLLHSVGTYFAIVCASESEAFWRGMLMSACTRWPVRETFR